MTMSTSESESENDQFDDDIEDYTFDDTYNDDDLCDFDDASHFASLCDLIFGKSASDLLEAPTMDIPSNYSVRLAMDSQPHRSTTTSSHEQPLVNDSLQMYLSAPPLIRKAPHKGKPSVALDPTIDESGSKTLSTPNLFVGNIPLGAKWFELKNWFIELGYGVSNVDLKTNKVGKGARYAFVRFDSIATAVDVLHKSETKSTNFVFKGQKLNINRNNRSSQQPNKTPPVITIDDKPTTISFKITDIHYGTLVTGAAMRNIHRKNSIVSGYDEFGIIAHRLINDEYKTSFSFYIDMEKKKLAIVAHFDLMLDDASDLSTVMKFEWNFRDLKPRKITPVLINQTDVFLLVELKRSPIILETQYISTMLYDGSSETRLPGTGVIGHANAWLFKLSTKNLHADYMKLFSTLQNYNLCQRQFSSDNIIYLVRTSEAARKYLESLQLISNDEWVKKNQVKVDDFLVRRWPSYPFETKFEIMKLISKHTITVYDLIVDEQAEHILKMCTINTLIALTDKIVEFAPRWFGNTCDNEDEDWDIENEQEQQQQAEPEGNGIDNSVNLSHIRSSATGATLNAANTEIASITTAMKKHSLTSTNYILGTFSRLLIYALEQLLKKYELCRITPTGVYATKLELRTANINPFLIRKIYITPATILYEGPYREEKCAVTREFVEHQDRFLRVTFRDEDYRVLHNYNDNMSKMYERIKRILMNGIIMCDRHYQFLAFSSSQLREHSCWMFAAPNPATTVDTIRQWMGDFRNVHPVAKLAARLGQSFSTSIKGIELKSEQFREVSDKTTTESIGGGLRTHCITDGIGIISLKFAKKLTENMKLSNRSFCPSAFQIRCGGYKGMVCVDVSDSIKDQNVDVHFRRSMNKFIAKNFSVDVVRTSLTPSVAYLNRQIILLLSSLGIPNETFIYFQDQMLQQLKALTGNPQQACESLRDLNEFGGNGYHKFLIEYLPRLGARKDPFVQQLLLAFKAFLLKELRTKAKIRVPDSWTLLGVIDESRTLKYGQVFIQIDNSNQQKEGITKQIFQGPVIVTRNPCFHPGDIRKLEAVDVPLLHDLKNVIVFPMAGPRPHAMEMSGGDLDGDTFWICSHPKLIFPSNEEPFDYQDQEDQAAKEQSPTSVQHTIKDVCNFFGEYIAADNLGLIANSHLVFADQSSMGAKDSRCLTLAKMHSVAVDFAKNGVSAPRLTRELRPQAYPHYMEKRDKTSYKSTTILGVLYDKIECYQTDLYISKKDEIDMASSFPYKSFFIDGIDKNIMKEARNMKIEYDRDVKRVMRQYGIKHEVEIVSGYILRFTSKQYAKETKLFELRNEITYAYRVIQDKHLRLFWQQFYQSTTDEVEEETSKWSEISKKITWTNQVDIFEFYKKTKLNDEVKEKASAWFRITYEPWITYVNKIRKNKPENQQERFNGLFSFAWLVYPVLLEIFDEKRNDSKDNTEPKKRRRKKKNKGKDLPILSNNSNRQT